MNIYCTFLYLKENENSDTVQLEVCDDNEPEPAESFYVYLTVVAGGGRVAGPGNTPQRVSVSIITVNYYFCCSPQNYDSTFKIEFILICDCCFSF